MKSRWNKKRCSTKNRFCRSSPIKLRDLPEVELRYYAMILDAEYTYHNTQSREVHKTLGMMYRKLPLNELWELIRTRLSLEPYHTVGKQRLDEVRWLLYGHK